MAHHSQKSPYELLGVSPDDDPAVIRRAWHAMIRAYHPDLAKSDRTEANRRLAEINAAFDAVWGDVAPDPAQPRDKADAAHRRDFMARRQKEKRQAEAERRAHMRAANTPTAPRSEPATVAPPPPATTVIEISSQQPVMTEAQLALYKFLTGLRTLNKAPRQPQYRASL